MLSFPSIRRGAATAVAVLTALAAAAVPNAALAQAGPGIALPRWEAGAVAAGASQPAYPGASDRTARALVLPYLVYRGTLLRADRENVGLRALKTPNWELNIGFAGSFGSDAGDVEARRGMADLGTLVEFGPRLQWKLGTLPQGGRIGAEVALRGVFDLSDGLRHVGVSFEPRLTYEQQLPGGWRVGANAGVVLGNQRLARTFYGVSAQEVAAGRPEYTADGGVIAWRTSANLSHELTRDVRVFGFLRLETVRGAANRDSPLVQRNEGATVGLGLVYVFGRSSTLVTD